MERAAVRILLVEDFQPFRHIVSSLLQAQPEYQVVGEIPDGLLAVHQAEQLKPDLILLDIGLPGLNGIDAAREIRLVSPGSKILFVTENDQPEAARAALATGALGYVIKSYAADELLAAMEAVLSGKRFVSGSLAGNGLTDPDDM